jgi:hypothetical protein
VSKLSMLAIDAAEARGKSLASAAVISLNEVHSSRPSLQDDFIDQESGFVLWPSSIQRRGSETVPRPEPLT